MGGRTILARQIERLAPQVTRIVLNANADPARFAAHGLPVIADTMPHAGPLAGILAALDFAFAQISGLEWVLTVPGDVPFLPPDLVSRLHAARRSMGAALACAASQGRTHPVIALWPVTLREALRRAMVEQDVRRVGAFTSAHACAIAEWTAIPLDPFFNINTPEDLAEANRLAAL